MDFFRAAITVVGKDFASLTDIESTAREMSLEVSLMSSCGDVLNALRLGESELVIIDNSLPSSECLGLIRAIRNEHKHFPILIVCSPGEDRSFKQEAHSCGATDFLCRPLEPVEFSSRLKNAGMLGRCLQLVNYSDLFESDIGLAVSKAVELEQEALMLLGTVAELKDSEIGNHTLRVGGYARLLTKALGLDEKDQGLIYYASQLHDIGKIGVPDNILLKPGKLTSVEFEIVKDHTTMGYDFLKDRQGMYLKIAAIVAVSHHERFDGSGYPYGLSGQDIPLWGRITSVADVFDVLTSRRPYKEPMSVEAALETLKNSQGSQFDPDMIEAFISAETDVREVYQELAEGI